MHDSARHRTVDAGDRPRQQRVDLLREVVPAPNANRKRGAQAHCCILRDREEVRGSSPEQRRLVRQQKSRLLADAFEAWLRAKQALISQKIKLAEAIRCALPAGRASRATSTTAASNSTTIPCDSAFLRLMPRIDRSTVFCTSHSLQAWPGIERCGPPARAGPAVDRQSILVSINCRARLVPVAAPWH